MRTRGVEERNGHANGSSLDDRKTPMMTAQQAFEPPWATEEGERKRGEGFP